MTSIDGHEAPMRVELTLPGITSDEALGLQRSPLSMRAPHVRANQQTCESSSSSCKAARAAHVSSRACMVRTC
eukprot:1725762-Prymnesium_polylepis.1